MAKQGSRADVNTFVQGLITEASPLNFPSNASIDEVNYDLNRDGSRDRRLGIDLEPLSQDVALDYPIGNINDIGLNSFRWYSVNGLQDRDFLVIQEGKYLLFFDLNQENLSADGFLGKLELASFDANVRYSFTALEGKLVVVCGTVAPIGIVTYNSATTVFSVEYARIKVRDVWGIEILGSSYETDPSYRGGYDARHTYNLYNQSWGIPRKNKTGTLTDPVKIFFDDKTKYPSNIESVWPGLQYQAVVSGADPYERIYPNLYDDVLGSGDVLSAKGYFIIDLFNRGTSRSEQVVANKTKYSQMELATLTTVADSTTKGASCVAEFAGRVFYGGFNGELVNGDKRSPNLSNFVMFSQVVKNIQDVTKCYQEGDPTSRESSDVVDTDGGFFRVSGAEQIISMVNIGSHLIILATNGIWAVKGGSDYGFTATNYSVIKVSNFGCMTSSSIVEEGGRLYFWSEDGIYAIAKNQYGDITVDSISKATIQTYYENISEDAKYTVTGVYDQYSKKVRWLYREGELFTSSCKVKELILDTTIGCFYPHEHGVLEGNVVYAVSLVCANILPKSSIRESGISATRYVVLIKRDTDAYMCFAYHRDEQFLDWKSVDDVGIDAKAYLMTGEVTAGDTAVHKQIPYLVMHFRRTENGVTNLVPDHQSSCLVRSMWDWANSVISNKWSPFFQAYRYRKPRFIIDNDDDYDTGFKTVVSKNKIRGRGRAFSFYMETEPLKDCRILGWNITINGNANT